MKPKKISRVWIFIIGMSCLVSCGMGGIKAMMVAHGHASTSEAKAKLAQLFAQEKQYFEDNSKYSPCVNDLYIGYNNNNFNHYYVGFGSDSTDVKCNKPGTVLMADSRLKNFDYLQYFQDAFVSNNAYTLVAVGNICDGCPLDIWSINENKEIVNRQSGVPVNYWNYLTGVLFLAFISLLYFRRRTSKGVS